MDRLVTSVGAVEALRVTAAHLESVGSDAPSLADAAEKLRSAATHGIRFITPSDDEWPAGLADLERPGFIKDRGLAGCHGLWVVSRAPLAPMLVASMSVVGTRTPSSTGSHVASELATGLADAGWTTVSGAAYGIDAAAHRGALAGGAPTVAVLASGVDVRYPSGNAAMLGRVAETGAIISEVPPGCAPMRKRFLIRNRLIAAMSPGTVIVEAGLRSGARNTLAHARALNRIVMAVPGSVTSPVTAGSNAELKRMETIAVMCAADAIEATAAIGAAAQLPLSVAVPGPRDGLSETEAEVLDAVPVRTPRPATSIARTSGHGLLTAAAALTRLESLGLVRGSEAGYRLTAVARAPDGSPSSPMLPTG